jgi:hypothetical protein
LQPPLQLQAEGEIGHLEEDRLGVTWRGGHLLSFAATGRVEASPYASSCSPGAASAAHARKSAPRSGGTESIALAA